MTLPDEFREEVYRFIWADVKKHKCRLIRIGGIANHIHMLVDLNPNEKLSELMRDIKANSSGWLRRDSRFVHFDGWTHEYFAATVSPSSCDAVIKYINGQVEHHKCRDFRMELAELYQLAGIQFDERDMQ